MTKYISDLQFTTEQLIGILYEPYVDGDSKSYRELKLKEYSYNYPWTYIRFSIHGTWHISNLQSIEDSYRAHCSLHQLGFDGMEITSDGIIIRIIFPIT